MSEHTASGLGWMAKGRFLFVAALLTGSLILATGSWAATTNYVLTDGSNGNTATTSVTAAVPPANNTTSVAGVATYASLNGDNGTSQFLNGGNGAIEAVQLVLTIGETPADITSIDVLFSGYATAAGNLNLYIWNGTTWTSMGTMALTTADTTPAPVNFAGSFASYVIGGKIYLQYVLPAAANTDLYVDYVAVNVNYTVAVPNNPLLHNSISTASAKWPTIESGKAVAGWGIPDAQYGEFTCATCHARNTGNIKRIKTSLTAPTDSFPIQAASGTINFQATSGANSFGDDGRAVKTSSSMICEGCHSKTAVHRFNSSSITDFNHKNANQTDCISCHPHKVGFKPLACDSCHGYPPTTLAGLVTGTDATGSTTFGAHQRHAVTLGYACENCHNGYVMPNTGDIDIHFSNFGSITGTYTGQAAANYNGSAGTGGLTCNSVYCHSSGQSTDGASATPVYVAPTWNGGAVACGSCHGNIPATGSHTSHVADATTECADCHTGAVEATTAPTTGHIDRVIDVNSGSYTKAGAPGNGYGTCTASCHNTGRNSGGLTGTWGNTLNNCSECHPTVPATGGHAAHVGVSFAGAAMNCDDCHTGAVEGTTAPTAGHRDSNIDAVGYATANKALGSAFTTCTTASCHQDGLVNNTHYINTPAWDADTANCSQCHAASPTTGSHTKHIAATSDCDSCHGAAALKDTSYASAAHGDLNIDVAIGGYAANKAIASAYTGCTAVTCHSDGMAASGNTPVWGNTSGCAACHLSNMTTGSHTKHLAEADCGACHADAVKDTTAPTGGVHADGNVDVYNATPLDMGYPVDRAYGSATWTTCTAASCHDKGRGGLATTPAWGVSKTDCTECHAGATITTGSHGSHIAAGETCTDCHDAATNVATETEPAAGHRDTNIDTNVALGYTQNKAKDSAFTTCATASCHNTGRNSGGLTGTWGNTLNNCSECHPTVPTTAAHTKHVTSQTISSAINCAACHTGTTQGTTAGAGHRDGNIDVTTGAYPADKALGSAYTNCTTSYCHSNGKGTFQSVSWSATSTGCDFCHGNPPAGTHSAGDTDCSSCHNHVAAADTSFSNAALHINGIVEAQADDCTTCHGAGKSRDPEASDPDHKAHTSMAVMLSGKTISGNDFGNSAWWYGVSYDASSKPLMGCGQCHPADVSLHKNSVVNTKLTSAGEAGIPAINAKRNNGAAAIFSAGKCSAVYCHGDGINDATYPDSPTWDLTLGNAGMNCASCHGNSPATNAHGLHAVGIHYDTLYDDDAMGLMPAAAVPATDAGAAHGNGATSDTIGCQSCHNSTVTVEYNAGNSVCGTCHSDSNAPVTGNELAIIAASSSAHLDGAKTVAFATLTGFKSKAQVRSDIATVSELNSSWTRTNNYKAAAGTSFDAAKAVVPGWNSGAKTCSTVDCHNGILTPAWGTVSATGNCLACHTNLP